MRLFCSKLRKGGSDNTTETRRLSKEEIRKQLIDSLINSENVETEDLKEKSDKVKKSEDAATIIKEYQEIILIRKKSIVCIAYQKGKVFRKFKETKKFIKMVKKVKVCKTTIIFKINIVKLIDKYHKLMNSSVH